jgi:hypothetical protein
MFETAPLQADIDSKKHAPSAERRRSAVFMEQQCTPHVGSRCDEFVRVVGVARNYDQTWRSCADLAVFERVGTALEALEAAGMDTAIVI